MGRFKSALLVLIVLVCFGASPDLYSQTRKLDSVERDLAETFPEYILASAVVLFDKAKVEFNEEMNLTLSRHLRLKVLNNDFLDSTLTLSIPIDPNLNQKLIRFKAATYQVGNNGELDKRKIKSDQLTLIQKNEMIYKEFNFSGLTAGSIIEYTYAVRGDFDGSIPSWSFQSSNPTIWSEFEIRMPSDLEFTTLIQGIGEFEVQNSESYFDPITRKNGTHFVWAMKDQDKFDNDAEKNDKQGNLIASIALVVHSFILDGVRSHLKDSWGNVISDFHGNRIHEVVPEITPVVSKR